MCQQVVLSTLKRLLGLVKCVQKEVEIFVPYLTTPDFECTQLLHFHGITPVPGFRGTSPTAGRQAQVQLADTFTSNCEVNGR